MQKSYFLHNECRLTQIYIYMKFYEDILKVCKLKSHHNFYDRPRDRQMPVGKQYVSLVGPSLKGGNIIRY